MTALMWFRRDLRLADNPALGCAAARGAVVPVFVVDPNLIGPAGPARRTFLAGCLGALDDSLDGALVIRTGAPADVLSELARDVGASTVCAAADFGPYGRTRDATVAERLAAGGVELELIESPYAAPPGTVTKADGSPYRVFTPFYRAWQEHADGNAAASPTNLELAYDIASDSVPDEPTTDAVLPPAGEAAALARLTAFLDEDIDGYADDRDRADRDRTSRLSPYLKYGCVHPRQVLERLGRGAAHETMRRELAWREFYADVLFHQADSARESLQAAAGRIRVDTGADADRRFAAWAAGRTGYPIVDAGMRQLIGEAWMHNRARMIVASFLVKDLHLDWRRGARLFMERLVDGDLASNSHGWQWVAGTGTDAAPYHRIFNPTVQGKRFDPDGAYVRRWVPELAGIDGPAIHEPWKRSEPVPGYPAPIVDHAAARLDALDRYSAVRAGD